MVIEIWKRTGKGYSAELFATLYDRRAAQFIVTTMQNVESWNEWILIRQDHYEVHRWTNSSGTYAFLPSEVPSLDEQTVRVSVAPSITRHLCGDETCTTEWLHLSRSLTATIS